MHSFTLYWIIQEPENIKSCLHHWSPLIWSIQILPSQANFLSSNFQFLSHQLFHKSFSLSTLFEIYFNLLVSLSSLNLLGLLNSKKFLAAMKEYYRNWYHLKVIRCSSNLHGISDKTDASLELFKYSLARYIAEKLKY